MDENRLREDRSELAVRRALIGFSSTDEGRPPMHPTLEPSSRSAASSPQHICVVTETYPPEINGVALTLANLVKGLLARGHTVSVVHPGPHNASSSNEIGPRSYSEPIPVRGLPLPGYDGLQFGVPAQRRLRRSWT